MIELSGVHPVDFAGTCEALRSGRFNAILATGEILSIRQTSQEQLRQVGSALLESGAQVESLSLWGGAFCSVETKASAVDDLCEALSNSMCLRYLSLRSDCQSRPEESENSTIPNRLLQVFGKGRKVSLKDILVYLA